MSKPYRCPEHPNAKVIYKAEKHSWFWLSWEKEECAECGLELALKEKE